MKNCTRETGRKISIMFINNILYEDNVLVTIMRRDDPFGVTGFFSGEDAAERLHIFLKFRKRRE